MRVACVFVTHLRAKVELLRQPHLKTTSAVIVGRDRGHSVVLDTLPKSSGAVVGMTVEEALSHRAYTMVIEADEPYYRNAFGEVLGLSLIHI